MVGFQEVGNFVARGKERVDPRLRRILEEAARRSGRRVEAFSGYRPGDKGKHGKGQATDIRLYDDQGKPIPNYQNAQGFHDYEQFAKVARQVQQELYPDMNDQFRWGGYFGLDPRTGRPRYGTMDLMHFDVGGGPGLGMRGGSWEGGISPQLATYYGLQAGQGGVPAAVPAMRPARPSDVGGMPGQQVPVTMPQTGVPQSPASSAPPWTPPEPKNEWWKNFRVPDLNFTPEGPPPQFHGVLPADPPMSLGGPLGSLSASAPPQAPGALQALAQAQQGDTGGQYYEQDPLTGKHRAGARLRRRVL